MALWTFPHAPHPLIVATPPVLLDRLLRGAPLTSRGCVPINFPPIRQPVWRVRNYAYSVLVGDTLPPFLRGELYPPVFN